MTTVPPGPARLQLRPADFAATWPSGWPRPFWVLIALGVAFRLVWAALRAEPAIGEAGNIAAALAAGRGYADAYRVGQGPTAHLLPTTPLIAGFVYKLLGIRSVAAEAVLLLMATSCVVGSLAVWARAFARLGTPSRARLAALAVGCFLSPYLSDEISAFRCWDGALAALLAASLLNELVGLDGDTAASRSPPYVRLAMLGAVTCFVQPMIGLGALCAATVLVTRRLPPADWARLGLIAMAVLAALVTPWAIRNDRVLGSPVLLRSNLGLELAISMYPGADAPGLDPEQAFRDRWGSVHPERSAAAFARMEAVGGEVRYSSVLAARSEEWMRAHPTDVLLIATSHLGEVFVPPVWLMRLENRRLVLFRTCVADAVGVLGLLGLSLAFVQRRRGWTYAVLMTIVPSIAFSAFQPIPRYDYLFFGLLTFAAADFIAQLAAIRSRRRARDGIACRAG